MCLFILFFHLLLSAEMKFTIYNEKIIFYASFYSFLRSTKSDKTYPSMLSRVPQSATSGEIETEPYYCLPVNGNVAWSQPTSPTPRNLTGLISPTHTNSNARLIYHNNKKNDEGKRD